MVGWKVLSRPSAAEGGGRRPAFTGLATQPYSATEVDGWQQLSRVSQNRAAVQPLASPRRAAYQNQRITVSSSSVARHRARALRPTRSIYRSAPHLLGRARCASTGSA